MNEYSLYRQFNEAMSACGSTYSTFVFDDPMRPSEIICTRPTDLEATESLLTENPQFCHCEFQLGLEIAAKKGSCALIELILSKPTDEPIDLNSAMMVACNFGHTDAVNLLCSSGANKYNWGLCGACYGGHLAVAQDMITRGATNFGQALVSACSSNSISVIDLLTSHTIDMTYYNKALLECSSEQMIDLLITKAPSTLDFNSAIINRNGSLIDYLIKKASVANVEIDVDVYIRYKLRNICASVI